MLTEITFPPDIVDSSLITSTQNQNTRTEIPYNMLNIMPVMVAIELYFDIAILRPWVTALSYLSFS